MIVALQQQPPAPVIVKIIPPAGEIEGLSDVLIGALGLTGVLVLSAVALALVFAGGLYLFRLKFGNPYPSASSQHPGDGASS